MSLVGDQIWGWQLSAQKWHENNLFFPFLCASHSPVCYIILLFYLWHVLQVTSMLSIFFTADEFCLCWSYLFTHYLYLTHAMIFAYTTCYRFTSCLNISYVFYPCFVVFIVCFKCLCQNRIVSKNTLITLKRAHTNTLSWKMN